jgi:hypothetical protein
MRPEGAYTKLYLCLSALTQEKGIPHPPPGGNPEASISRGRGKEEIGGERIRANGPFARISPGCALELR